MNAPGRHTSGPGPELMDVELEQERLARMAAAWTASAPRRSEIQRARGRALARAAARRPAFWQVLPVVAAVALVLILWIARSQEPAPISAAPDERATLPVSTASELAPAPAIPESNPSTEATGATTAAPTAIPPPSPRAAPTEAPRAAPTSRSDAVVDAGTPTPDETWRRATEAMKRNDFAGADSALSELNTSGDRGTRESSRLARAELWIANGRAAEVRPLLVDLQREGSTEYVRKRAAALLNSEPAARPNGDRSQPKQ